MRPETKEEFAEAALCLITLPPILDLITCGRYQLELLKKFKLELEKVGKTENLPSRFLKISALLSLNTPFVELGMRNFVNVIYSINDNLNKQAKINLNGDSKLATVEVFHLQMNKILDRPTQTLNADLDSLYEFLLEKQSLAKAIFNNQNELLLFSGLFKDFVYPFPSSKTPSTPRGTKSIYSAGSATFYSQENSSSSSTSSTVDSLTKVKDDLKPIRSYT